MGATPIVAGPRGRAIWINEPVSAMIARGAGSFVREVFCSMTRPGCALFGGLKIEVLLWMFR